MTQFNPDNDPVTKLFANNALDDSFYNLNEAELAFFKAQTELQAKEELKRHIVDIQIEAYKIYPYPCIRMFTFTSYVSVDLVTSHPFIEKHSFSSHQREKTRSFSTLDVVSELISAKPSRTDSPSKTPSPPISMLLSGTSDISCSSPRLTHSRPASSQETP
ncbi:uncharacterized protein FIBRA_04096 [Fibroporia radiculosa]|uniref:Uncharacterized protein n=1 Tax=Fibroporia radiculosa TaxID=599839 RepID=J4GNX2_9APHY|nr:uncharacterized protein FIBRA_04096 [Fibroporia radiculosa]CCM02020.1 predicted protein [Fibroporia radiculosa]